MDYEKKYKEALEWARKVMQGKVGFVLDEVLEKFPELKESEDEKIRKWLINYLRNRELNSSIIKEKESLKKAIAWLEKQGEQKSTWSEEDKSHLNYIICHLEYLRDYDKSYQGKEDKSMLLKDIDWLKKQGNLMGALQEVNKKIGELVEDNYYLKEEQKGKLVLTPEAYERILKLGEKQSKQKPAWSEEDENRLNSCISILNTSDGFETLNSKWLKSLKNRILPQPKQEWSEDSVKEALLSEVLPCFMHGGEADEVIAKLDEVMSTKVQLQPKQEWSEEDERHVNSLLKRLEGLCRNEFERTRFAINEDEDWLKSLKERCTWKPSDEQMEALHDAAVYVDKSMFPYPKGILMKLYKQLKKLKEK